MYMCKHIDYELQVRSVHIYTLLHPLLHVQWLGIQAAYAWEVHCTTHRVVSLS